MSPEAVRADSGNARPWRAVAADESPRRLEDRLSEHMHRNGNVLYSPPGFADIVKCFGPDQTKRAVDKEWFLRCKQ